MRWTRRALVRITLAACIACIAAAGAPAVTRADSTTSFGDRSAYLAAAEEGLGQIKQQWWNQSLGWYDKYLTGVGVQPLATAWDIFPLFEGVNAVALADPTPANVDAVKQFGIKAEDYWNPDLKPIGGYAFYPGQRGTSTDTFFDDTGWLGVSFFDAYKVTGDKRFLRDAIRAFRFIDIVGWAGDRGGGIWWDTDHQYKTAEPLAAAALLGGEIYERTHIKWYLKETKKLLAWADKHAWNGARHLYARSDTSDTVMNYVEGMYIGAQVTLCRATHVKSRCTRAEQLAAAATVAFPPDYHWAPETDVVYLRWMLDLYANDHNVRWYAVADAWAKQALTAAKDDRGLYTKRWDGGYASPDRLLTVAGTVSLFAWMAAAPAPPSS